MAAQKIYQAETELENARELRNWKELTDRLAKHAAKFPDRELVQSLYDAERVFDTKRDFATAQELVGQALKRSATSVEAHVLAAVLHSEKNNAKEALAELEALDRVVAPTAEALASRRVLRYVVDGLRLKADLLQKQGAAAAAFAANCALIDVCQRAFGKLPAGCTSRRINSHVDRSLRKISEAVASEADARCAVEAYRKCLMPPLAATLTQTIRFKTLRLLFELDMYGTTQSSWPPYSPQQLQQQQQQQEEVFVPASPAEEAALANTILQHETASISQDLDEPFAVLLGSERQCKALVWLLEKSIASAPEDAAQWAQLAYALDAAGRSLDALCICDQCLFAAPDDLGMLLFACLLCLNKLGDNSKAIAYADTAIRAIATNTTTTNTTTNTSNTTTSAVPVAYWRSRFNLCAGVAAQKLALEATLHADRQHWQAQALGYLQHALRDNADSPLANHFMALQFAEMREIDTALLFERRALALDPRSPEGWNALALLYSAKQWTLPALAAVDVGLRNDPENANLLMTRASLQLGVGAAGDSIESCLAAARRAKDIGVRLAAGGGAAELPAEMCLALSKAFRMLGQWEDAKAALVEQFETSAERSKDALASLLAASASLLQQRGTPGALEEAQSFVDRALAVCPTSIDALLASAQLAAGAKRVALEEANIASVLASYPLSHTAWKAMGLILHESGMNDYAEECLLAAARLEATNPVRPFALCSRKLCFTHPF